MNWEKYSKYSLVNLSLQRFINHELNIRGPKVFITDVLHLGSKNNKSKKNKKRQTIAYKIYNHFENRINPTGLNTFNNSIRRAVNDWDIEFGDDHLYNVLGNAENVGRWLGILSGLVMNMNPRINLEPIEPKEE